MKSLIYVLPILLGLCGASAAQTWNDCKGVAGRYLAEPNLTIWITRVGTTWGDYTAEGGEMPGLLLELENPKGRGTLHGPGVSNLFAGPPIENFKRRYEWNPPESSLMPGSMYWRSDDGMNVIAQFVFQGCEAPPFKKPADDPKPAP